MTQPLHIFSFSGSLRAASTNTRLLRIIQSTMLPDGVTMEIFDLTPLPLYNPDVESQGFPEVVRDFRQKIAQADAILIACPEYNYSVTSALKSALDWASRPPQNAEPGAKQPLNAKPLGIVGGGGRAGSTRAQLHLRQIATYLNMYPINQPEVLINNIRQHFDENGEFTDQAALGFMRQHVENLVAWTRLLKASQVPA